MYMSRTLVLTPNIAFLPGDDDDDARASTSKASIAVDALNVMFTACASRATSREFWTFIAAHGRDVERGIDTYLQFKRRPYEYATESRGSSTAALDELSRNVFVTLARVVNDGTYERIDRTLATSDERQRLIDEYALIDVPKLIDVCVLYGQENRELVDELLTRAVSLKPTLVDDFIRCGTIVGDNLTEMSTRVISAANSGDLPLEALSDALEYFNDVAVSFVSLVVAHAPAREWVTRDGKLINSMDLVRSMAIPALEGVCNDADNLSAVRDSLNAAISSLQSARDSSKIEASTADDAYVGIPHEIITVIDSVRAVLPDVGIGFVKACVDHFGPNAELIVQHLFEDSLPLNLSTLDRNLGWPPAALQTLRKTSSTATGSTQAPAPTGYFLARKVNRDVDLEKSADDHRVLTAILDLEYEDEYDDSFDDLPVQVANTAIDMDEFDIESSKSAQRGSQSGTTKRTFYLLGGKVYHAPKEGAEKILATSAEEASSIAVARAKAAANQIEGLGAGGNKARFASEGFVPSTKAAPFVPGGTVLKATPEPREGSSGGRGRGAGGRATRGLTAKDFAHKHHNQKAKAAKKAGL